VQVGYPVKAIMQHFNWTTAGVMTESPVVDPPAAYLASGVIGQLKAAGVQVTQAQFDYINNTDIVVKALQTLANSSRSMYAMLFDNK
jgi:hypothetical protein